MARFASEAKLETFLGRLDPDYSQFASTLWQNGVRTACQLANATKPLLLSYGLPELYIDDINATADTTGELNALNACTVCLVVHMCCLLNASRLNAILGNMCSHIFAEIRRSALGCAFWRSSMFFSPP